jgi:hypothetical protein
MPKYNGSSEGENCSCMKKYKCGSGKWQVRAVNRCMDILGKHDGASIAAITPDLMIWKGAEGREQQEVGVEVNREEGRDPLQFTLEDWIDQERNKNHN